MTARALAGSLGENLMIGRIDVRSFDGFPFSFFGMLVERCYSNWEQGTGWSMPACSSFLSMDTPLLLG